MLGRLELHFQLFLRSCFPERYFPPRSLQLQQQSRPVKISHASASPPASLSNKPSAARASNEWRVLPHPIRKPAIHNAAKLISSVHLTSVDRQPHRSPDTLLFLEKSTVRSSPRDQSSHRRFRFRADVSPHLRDSRDRHCQSPESKQRPQLHRSRSNRPRRSNLVRASGRERSERRFRHRPEFSRPERRSPSPRPNRSGSLPSLVTEQSRARPRPRHWRVSDNLSEVPSHRFCRPLC